MIGITPEHCGRHCTLDCARLAADAVREAVPGLVVCLEDLGPWQVDDSTRNRIERAMNDAPHGTTCGS